MIPVILPEGTWRSFLKHGLIITPQEYRRQMLHDAPDTKIEDSQHAREVLRMLALGIHLVSDLHDLQLIFKDIGTSKLDLLMDGKTMFLNSRYLEFKTAHKRVPCFVSEHLKTKSSQHACDHVAEHLFGLILEEIEAVEEGHPYYPVMEDGAVDKFMVNYSTSLRQMPRSVLMRSSSVDNLIVEWVDLESGALYRIRDIDAKVRVTLHRESTCGHVRRELLVLKGPTHP